MSFVVLKFGGTSVSSVARWQTIATQIRERLDHHLVPIVVCSALSGVTNALEALLAEAVDGDAPAALAALRERHVAFARELGVDPALVEPDLVELERWIVGAGLVGETSPRVRARVLAKGEILLTRLGAAWLGQQGVDARWVDARDLLQSDGSGTDARRFLSATVDARPDPAVAAALAGAKVVLTQGFVARDPAGETVLLGRGGSDTSAALLAAKVGASRCEIWTDVPGMFTADPHKLPGARLLKALDYAEAQEIATMGAKVLHPRCLAPVRDARIPLEIRCTPNPGLERTRISAEAPGGPAQVKAISGRKGLVLVSMDTLGMWQQVGFLADAFAVFKQLGLSVDVVSTSETEVTVTLDPAANALDGGVLDALVLGLQPHCRAEVVVGAASISLVGRGIRGILHRLAPVLELFEEHRVHLVSQAASDLNLTFVVDESQADRLMAKLHALLFAHRGADEVLGSTWQELFAPTPRKPAPPRAAPWWERKRDALLGFAAQGTPAYVYDAETVLRQADGLLELPSVARVLYAMKANAHPELVRLLGERGLGFETVSPGEIARAHEAAPGAPVLFTPNFAPRAEVAAAFHQGVQLTLDNLHPLEKWPELFVGRDLFVRLDPGRGRGHHAHVRTAGARSKFGIGPDQLDRLAELVRAAGARVTGLHAHVGSGVLDPLSWQDVGSFLATVGERFPDASVLDLGGGLGVPDRPGRPALDLGQLEQGLAKIRGAHPERDLWLEPGRYLVAEAGVLLATVTQVKRKGELVYVGVDAGMHTLIRPALYGAYHPVVNLTRLGEPASTVATVVGPICESGDVLARDRKLAEPREGDVLLIAVTGAYGASMASDYNLRGRPREGVLR
ncbi:MAG: bifunctional aspartate kinase/diaminopimelate decarboxylase [Myxococcota bacterium]